MTTTAFTGDKAFTQEYSATLMALSQQKDSRFKPYVRIERVNSAEAAYFPTIGKSDAPTALINRHEATPITEVPINNRKVIPTPWEAGHLLDDQDLARQKINMQGGYMEADVYSFNRKTDLIIRDAAFGIAYTGKDGGTNVSALEKESVGINGGGGAGYPVSFSTLGTAPARGSYACGLTLAKMLGMAKLFNTADVDPNLAKYWAISYSDVSYLLGLTQVGNADYNTVKTLTEGKVETFMGFRFIPSNLLGKTDGCFRTFAWAEGGLLLAYIGDMKTQMAPDPSYKFNLRLYSKMDLGAVRMEGSKVHECLTIDGKDATS